MKPWRVTYQMVTDLMLPPVFLYAACAKRLRGDLEERLGRGAWRVAPRNAVWFHAASVGELAGVEPVISALRARGCSAPILLSTTSETGKQTALERKLGDFVAVLPYDNPRLMRRLIEHLAPRCMAIAETELWPGLLWELEESRVPVVIYNARISDRALPRYRALRPLLNHIVQVPQMIFAQSAKDAERFLTLGARHDQVRVNGLSKLDRLSNSSPSVVSKADYGLPEDSVTFVAGSVRPEEDAVVIDAYAAARVKCPGLTLVIAPRHPERFAAVEDLLRMRGINFARRSEGVRPTDVLLLDTLGELARVYAIANIAFVGATLVPIGGHNVFEPAEHGVAVLFGPHTANVRESAARLLEAQAAILVHTGRDLEQALVRLYREDALRIAMGQRGLEAWKQNQGASERVAETLAKILELELPQGQLTGEVS